MGYQPVTDNAAWRATEFETPGDYSLRLVAGDVADLDAAIAAAADRGLAVTELRRSDFPLPTLGPKLAAAYDAVRSGRGFVVIRGLPASERPAAWMRAAVWGIGTRFGTAVNQLIQGSLLVDVRDASKSATDVRYYNTAAELDLHVDPTCDIVGLACYRQAAAGGETHLCSAITVHNDLVAERPDLLPLLYRGFHLHRFGEYWPEDGDVTGYRVPFFANVDGKLSWRGFHPGMIAAARDRGEPLTDAEIEAIETFNAIARRPENRLVFALAPGDMWITNNLAVLHGRGRFEDDRDGAAPRHLLRLWLEGHYFRPIPREMNFFNRGASGIPLVEGRVTHYGDPDGLRNDPMTGRTVAPAWARHGARTPS